LAKRSIKEIIEDWEFSVWKAEYPRTFQSRRDAYYRLFNTLKQEGYGWEDFSPSDDKYIKSFTVGDKGTGQQRHQWTKYADKHILDAKIQYFGTRGKIAPAEALPEEKSVSEEEIKIQEPVPLPNKLKEYVPSQKALEAIDKSFKFEVSDEDIE